jgi:hypothetical protein
MLSRNKIAAAIGGVLFVIFAANFQSFPGGLLNLFALPALGLPVTIAYAMETQEKGDKIEVGGILLMLLLVGPLWAIFAGLLLGIPYALYVKFF